MPMLLTHRTFGHDWTLHLWLIRQQQLNLQAMSHPGLFVSTSRLGVFYPVFAFVGSGLYTLGGLLAIGLGDRPILASKLLYIVGLCVAYGGMTWLSLQLGLRGWRCQMPGLVLVTGAYYITDLAGRGDLGELAAISAIPLLFAAGRSLFASPRVRARDLLAVVAATFFVTGSNNITLLWGTAFTIGVLVLCLFVFAPTGLPALQWSRVAALAGSGAIGTGLNAWFLVPDLKYGLDTRIANEDVRIRPATVLAGFGTLMNPLRTADTAGSPWYRDFRVTLPWTFAAWAVVTAAILWRNRPGPSRRAVAGTFVVSLLYVVFVAWRGAWAAVPQVLYNIQFSVRLTLWVLILTGLLVLLVLKWQAAATGRTRQWTTAALVAIAVFNVGAATWQVWRVRSEFVLNHREVATDSTFADRVVASRYVPPASWTRYGDFRDGSSPEVDTLPARTLQLSPRAVHGSTFTAVVNVPDGPLPFSTNISAGPRFTAMTGIAPVGRTEDGRVVAVRDSHAPASGPIRVTIRQAESTELRAGALVSLVSCALLVALLAWSLIRFASARRSNSVVGARGDEVRRAGGLDLGHERTVVQRGAPREPVVEP